MAIQQIMEMASTGRGTVLVGMGECMDTDDRLPGHNSHHYQACDVRCMYGHPSYMSCTLGTMGPHSGSPPKMPMWQRFLDGLQRVVHCFGRVSFLVDENTQAFHFFITALLAFLDKAGSLYGEIARFVMRLLGFGRYSRRSRQIQRRTETTETLKTLWKKQ